jgi:hypothetical protein
MPEVGIRRSGGSMSHRPAGSFWDDSRHGSRRAPVRADNLPRLRIQGPEQRAESKSVISA